MTLEQLEKRVELLEKEKREAEQELAQLKKRVASYADALEANQQLVDQFRKETVKLTESTKDVEDFKKEYKTSQAEASKELKNLGEDARKEFKKQLKDVQDNSKSEVARLENEMVNLRKDLGVTVELEKKIAAISDADKELAKRIDEADTKLEGVLAGEEQRQQLASALEDTRARIEKDLSNALGDVASATERSEKAADAVKKFEGELNKMQKQFEEVLSHDNARMEEQRELKGKYEVEQLARERVWSEWEKRFEAVEKQSGDIAARLRDIESIDVAVRRAQTTFDGLIEKVNRRVNELSEVQRLGEQRFRQEWATFQADSQKRWSGYTLGQEELQREAARQREQLGQQITQIEDTLQDLQDVTQHVSEQTERYLQSMLEAVRDSLAESERFYSSMR